MNWFAICGDKKIVENGEFKLDRESLDVFGIQLKNETGQIDKEVYYDADNGKFILDDMSIDFEIENCKGQIYKLNDDKNKYNDCIAYKNFYQDLNGSEYPNDRGYSFGYKSKLEFEDLELRFQPLLVMNFGEKLMFTFRVVSNKDFKFKLNINVNGDEYKQSEIIDIVKDKSKEFYIIL